MLGIGVFLARTSQPSAASPTLPSVKPGPSEIVLVLIGSESCGAHGIAGFNEAVRRARMRIAAHAEEQGVSFASTGVSFDWSIQDGLRFLDRLGPWDEVIIGRNWFGFAAAHFVWRDLPGDPVIPQVIVLERQIERQSEAIIIGNYRVLFRIIGADNIIEWSQSNNLVDLRDAIGT
jgi:hypothetical protein